MANQIPASHADLLQADREAFAVLCTVMADGSRQATPVLFVLAAGRLRLNPARGRTSDRTMAARPVVALGILDPQEPQRHLPVLGRVVGVEEEGGRAHIDRLAEKHMGKATHPGPVTERRVIYTIEATAVQAMS